MILDIFKQLIKRLINKLFPWKLDVHVADVKYVTKVLGHIIEKRADNPIVSIRQLDTFDIIFNVDETGEKKGMLRLTTTRKSLLLKVYPVEVAKVLKALEEEIRGYKS